MPGPTRNATKVNSRAHRSTSSRGVIELPAGGCNLPVPPIPKGRAWTRQERALWRELWTSPQASQWDDSYRTAVAVYIAHSTALLNGEGTAWVAQEFRHLGDKLGLTPAGMVALGWVMSDE